MGVLRKTQPVIWLMIGAICMPSAALGGMFDFLDPNEKARQRAAYELKKESEEIGEPAGLFGTYWLMTKDEVLHVCKGCESHPVIPQYFRERRELAGITCSVNYQFIEVLGFQVLDAIIINPLEFPDGVEDALSSYNRLHNWIVKNIADMPKASYEKDSAGRVAAVVSNKAFLHSVLVHSIGMENGKVIQSIVLMRK